MKEKSSSFYKELMLFYICRLLAIASLNWARQDYEYSMNGRNHSYKAGGLLSSYEIFLRTHFPVLPSNGIFLDLGCGTGQLKDYLKQQAPDLHYVGIDSSAAGLAMQLRQDQGSTVVQSKAEELPLQDKSITFIHCKDLLPHIGNLGIFFGEISRVLKPEGIGIFVFATSYSHFRGYYVTFPEIVKKKIRDAHLQVIGLDTWRPPDQEINFDWYKESFNSGGVRRHVIILRKP